MIVAGAQVEAGSAGCGSAGASTECQQGSTW